MSREPLSPIAAWFRSSRRMLAAELSQGGWLNFGAFRWSDLDVPRALRAGVGMTTPLALGLATNHLEYGVFAALGALPAGMVSFQGASRTRVTAVVFAAVGMAVATLVGGVCAYLGGWLLFPAVLIFSYVGGLMATLGQRFLVVGLQWAIQLVIASSIPLAPGDAGVRALLVLAGGLWQGLLVVASWTVTSGNQERNSLAVAYRLLAGYAADSCRRPASSTPVPPPAVFDSQAVTDPNPLLRAQYRYRFLLLLQEAERIRVSLAAVAGYGPQCTVLEPVAGVLGGIADALEARRGHHALGDALQERLAAIELPADAPWRWAAAALLGELRGSVRTLRRLDVRDTEPTAEPVSLPGHQRGARRSAVKSALLTLAANVGTSTEAGRHALRLALVAGIGEIVAQASGLPHGYWIVLTILIVLRPDYTSTIYRGVQRAGGTVIGGGLGLATALLLHVGTAVLVAAVGVTMTVAYAVIAVNYLLFAVFLTDFVVTLMALLGETAEQTVTARLIGTGVGAALALIGYLAWPSWEGEPAQQKLARLFETQAHFGALVLRAYVRPGAVDTRALQAASRTTRQARSDAEASADRLNDEPSRPPMTARLAYSLTGIGRRMAHTSLTLQAALESTHVRAPGRSLGEDGPGPSGVPAHPAHPAQPASAGADGTTGAKSTVQAKGVARENGMAAATDRFADGIQTAAQVIAGSLRSLRPPSDMPPLREIQTVLYEQLTGRGKAPLAGMDTVLAGATDEFTDALDSAADILRRQLGTTVPGAGLEDPDVGRPGRAGRDDPRPVADGGVPKDPTGWASGGHGGQPPRRDARPAP
jgi:uncharacterized membrane protein YccC